MKTPAPVVMVDRISKLHELSDSELWEQIGKCRPGAPVMHQYSDELTRRASKATIAAANAARWSAILAAASIAIAAGVSITLEVTSGDAFPAGPYGVYLVPTPK